MSSYVKLVRRGSLALVAAAGLIAGSGASAGAVELAGTVRDSLGRAIEGAEIWLLPNSESSPVTQVRSDREGRFWLTNLDPGRNRVGVVKIGYRLIVAEIDTLLERTLDVVLRPTGDGALADPAWVLRTPRRSLWRETSAGLEPRVDNLQGIEGRDLAFRIDQRFAAASGAQSSGPAEAELRGSDTRVFVSAPIADEGDLRARVERIAAGTSDAAGGRLDSERMSVDLAASHAPSDRDRLRWAAVFSDRRSEAISTEPSSSADDDERALVLGASWQRELDSDRQVRVELDWARAEVDSGSASLSTPADPGTNAMYDRWRAQAALESARADGHRPSLRIGVAGERIDPASRDSELRLELDAGDRISATRGLEIEYGSKWIHAGAGRPQVVEPRVGARWSSGSVIAQAGVSWAHELAGDGSPADRFPSGAVGYEASISLPLAEGWELNAGSRLDPLVLDPGDGGRIDPSSLHPVYVAATGAEQREHLAGVAGVLGWGRLWIEGSSRRVEGPVLAFLPFAASGEGDRNAVQVATGRAGISVAASGTGIEIGWLRARSEPESNAGATSHSTIDVRVTQALGSDQARLGWRLLLAYQHAASRSELLDLWTDAGGAAETREALEHRLSAGVSVVY